MNNEVKIINDINCIPKVLYKYRDWDNLYHKKILSELELYFPSFDQFNDPFDGKIPVKYRIEDLTPDNKFKKHYSLCKIKYPDWDDQKIHEYCFQKQNENYIEDESHLEKMNNNFHNWMINNIGIFCLTSENNNHLMWSHYSNCHQGLCIGFNRDEIKKIIGDKTGIYSLVYEEHLPYLEIFEDDMITLLKLLCTKSKVWEYEKEYRIILFDFSKKTLKITPDVISEIILGISMNHSTKLEILDIHEKKFPNAKVFEAKRNKDFFKIDINQIK